MGVHSKHWLAAVGLAVAIAVSGPSQAQETKQQQTAPPAAATTEGWTGKVTDAGNAEVILSPGQLAAVNKVSGYFNGLTTLKGIFVQTDSDKTRSRGRFYVLRPGKFRFDYGPPSRKVMASDGRFLRIREPDQINGDAYQLDNTPFRLLLKKDVDLVRDARILDVQESEDLIVLALQDKSPDAPGRVQLYFTKKPELDLKEWVVLDAQGLETRVELSDLNKTDKIDSSIFVWENRMFQQP
ncbi:MAG: outer-membrane lipoprotein carrier protein LolA [Hyphomicrobiaceae bacterium]